MSLTTLFNRVWLLAAAHLTSGEDMAEIEPNEPAAGAPSATETVTSGGAATSPIPGPSVGFVHDVLVVGEDVVQDAKELAGKLEASLAGKTIGQIAEQTAAAGVKDVVAALIHLGTAHNALGSVGSSLEAEVSTIRALVESKIIALTKLIAA